MSEQMHPEELWTTRNGERRYTGHNGRGGRVEMGPVEQEGAFTPGELMKLALAGCAGMSSDFRFRRVLGDDYQVTIRVEATKHAEDDRYDAFRETFEIDLSSLDEETRAKTIASAQAAIDRLCTVGNTIKASAPISPAEYL
ncbi:MAG: OsmC family protein [Promicromonosporaceae bacterium]|nr:OsmC family protein [Promicromonosporaceae bacterium]